jgi:hypothetical protein
MDKENARQIRLSILGTNDDFEEWWEENKEDLSKDSELSFAMCFFENLSLLSEIAKKEQHDQFINLVSKIDCNLNKENSGSQQHLNLTMWNLKQKLTDHEKDNV